VVSVSLGVEAGHDGQRCADGGVRHGGEITADKGVLSDGQGTV